MNSVRGAILLTLLTPFVVRSAALDLASRQTEPRAPQSTSISSRPAPAKPSRPKLPPTIGAGHPSVGSRPATARSVQKGALPSPSPSNPTNRLAVSVPRPTVRTPQKSGTGIPTGNTPYRTPARPVLGGPAAYDPKKAGFVGGTVVARKHR